MTQSWQNLVMDGRTDRSDFIGCCLTNAKRSIKPESYEHQYQIKRDEKNMELVEIFCEFPSLVSLNLSYTVFLDRYFTLH